MQSKYAIYMFGTAKFPPKSVVHQCRVVFLVPLFECSGAVVRHRQAWPHFPFWSIKFYLSYAEGVK